MKKTLIIFPILFLLAGCDNSMVDFLSSRNTGPVKYLRRFIFRRRKLTKEDIIKCTKELKQKKETYTKNEQKNTVDNICDIDSQEIFDSLNAALSVALIAKGLYLAGTDVKRLSEVQLSIDDAKKWLEAKKVVYNNNIIFTMIISNIDLLSTFCDNQITRINKFLNDSSSLSDSVVTKARTEAIIDKFFNELVLAAKKYCKLYMHHLPATNQVQLAAFILKYFENELIDYFSMYIKGTSPSNISMHICNWIPITVYLSANGLLAEPNLLEYI